MSFVKPYQFVESDSEKRSLPMEIKQNRNIRCLYLFVFASAAGYIDPSCQHSTTLHVWPHDGQPKLKISQAKWDTAYFIRLPSIIWLKFSSLSSVQHVPGTALLRICCVRGSYSALPSSRLRINKIQYQFKIHLNSLTDAKIAFYICYFLTWNSFR